MDACVLPPKARGRSNLEFAISAGLELADQRGLITMTTVEIALPDQLAQDAQRAGLLSPARVEKWLRDQLEERQVDELFAAMDRMACVGEPAVMSPQDVADEIAAMRAERRARNAA